MMRVGSLFSGIGRIDLGFIQAGASISWAIDNDKYACKSYKHNLSSHLICEDIRSVNPNDLSGVDVLTAGFPCQPFSVMEYKRGFKDPRGNLFFEVARFADILKPRIIFLENVRNLINHDNGKTFNAIFATLAELGYIVKYKVINATDVNIPQDRARIFIVAFARTDDCNHFSFPTMPGLSRNIDDFINRSERQKDAYYYHSDSIYYNDLNRRIPDCTGIYRIDDSGTAMRKYSICPTLKANMGTYHDRVPILRDNYGIRKLTVEECLKLQGFPNYYSFPDIPENMIYKQMGNTVCVPVVRSIAERLEDNNVLT